MQIVIDIDDKIYDLCNKNRISSISQLDVVRIEKAIQNGTLLPQGHGRLKDEDEIVKTIEDRVEFLRKNDAMFMRLRKDIDILGCIPKIRFEVPTIIEADKESEE